MPSLHSSVESSQRLALQLQALTEITESLTYRLLGLEERLAGVDLQIQQLQTLAPSAGAALADDAELRLEDTEERISRLETLLGKLESVPAADEHDEHADSLGEERPSEDLEDASAFSADPAFCEDEVYSETPSFLDEQPFADDDSEHQAA